MANTIALHQQLAVSGQVFESALDFVDDTQSSFNYFSPAAARPSRTFGVNNNSSASSSSATVAAQSGDILLCRNEFSRHQHYYHNDACLDEETESYDKLGTAVGVERQRRKQSLNFVDSLHLENGGRATAEDIGQALPCVSSVPWDLARVTGTLGKAARRFSTPALALAQKRLSFGSNEIVIETLTTREITQRRKTIMFPSMPTTDDDKWIHRIYSELGGVSPNTIVEREQFLNIVDKRDLLYQHIFAYYSRQYQNEASRRNSIKVFDLYSELRRVAQMSTLDKIRLLFDVFSTSDRNGTLTPHDFKQFIKCIAKDRKISLSDEQLGAVVDTIFDVAKQQHVQVRQKTTCINAVTWADTDAANRRLSYSEFHTWLVTNDAGGEKRLAKATSNFLRPPSCDALQHLVSAPPKNSTKLTKADSEAARHSPAEQKPCAHTCGGGDKRSNSFVNSCCRRSRSLCNSILPRVFQPRYVRNHPSQAVWALMGIVLFIACFLYGQLNALFSKDPIDRGVTTPQCQRVYSGAKGFGFNLNVWTAVMILLMCRRTLSAIRNSPTLRHLVPVDSAVYAHKMIAWWVLTPCVIGHVGFHLAHFACLSNLPGATSTYVELLFTAKAHLGWLGSRVLLGWLLIICQVVIFVGALPVIRRSGLFEVFFWSHLLFVVYLIGLVLHSDKFIFFIAIPALIYAAEKLYSSQLCAHKTHGIWYLREAVLWPSGVTGLVLNRPDSFQYRPGDYIYLKIPAIARNEWHPFTISSAPENKGYMTLHIRSLGGWTRRLHEHLRTQYSDQIISTTNPALVEKEGVDNVAFISDRIIESLVANNKAVNELVQASAANASITDQSMSIVREETSSIQETSAISVVPHESSAATLIFYANSLLHCTQQEAREKLSNSVRVNRPTRCYLKSKSTDLSIHLHAPHRFEEINDDSAFDNRKNSAFSDYCTPTVIRIHPSPHGIRRSSSPTYLPSARKAVEQQQPGSAQRLKQKFNISSSFSTVGSRTPTAVGSPASSGYSTAARTSRTNSTASSSGGTAIPAKQETTETAIDVCEAPDGRSCTLKPPPPPTPSKQRREWPRSISILGQRVMTHSNSNSSKLSTASCLSTQASVALAASVAADSTADNVAANEGYDIEAGLSKTDQENFADQQSTAADTDLMRVYVDGPYGAPTSSIFYAEHAVLICAGIGITPSASILESLLLRYKACKVCCDSCERCWVSDGMLDDKLGSLKKVDFIWVVRSQAEVEWFHDRLILLEREQDAIERLRHFIQIHLYVTSAKKNDSDLPSYIIDAALDATYEHQRVDLITGLGYRAKPGRPNWEQLFSSIEENREGKVDVFYCGARTLGKELGQLSEKHNFGFCKENF